MQLANVLLALAAIVHAENTLTTCQSAQNAAVPCLKDSNASTTKLLDTASNQIYNFSHLNISTVENLPADAKYVDLSYNQIREINQGIPPSVAFLNLSHNALQTSWLQIPISATTVDISYNQRGLPWTAMENVWFKYLPSVSRVIYRGNDLAIVNLSYTNFPYHPHPLKALDWSDNPKLVINAAGIYNYLASHITVTADPTSYNNTLAVCENQKDTLVPIQSFPVEYSPQGDATYKPGNTTIYACSVGHFDPQAPSSASNGDGGHAAVYVVVGLVALGIVVFVIYRVTSKRRALKSTQSKDGHMNFQELKC
ncbi:hypothetical protein Ae201684_011379 [Aphanomyces euteiches]|uniref:Ig-like domain-containing protein n=1 Tax=Aphanomyces euteiches TaxID=100861 RepID=A0A6G0WV34_9STRA|nr:hypothetical protein Ae201684_011379 [Aphanomyces euteiches]KAH9154592.1 hypothetical protein AeRB84_003334 [Aphanomyces euteiches]